MFKQIPMLNGVSLLVNSCFKDTIRKGFYIELWPATKNAFTTIIPSTENYEKFTVPRLCSASGGTSSLWCIMSCYNPVKPSQGIGIKRN